MPIAVYSVTTAPVPVAGWLNGLLQPALLACRAEGRPVEFRPTGRWGGWSAGSRDRNPDGRISLSSQARFWTKTQFVDVYIHELSHCLLSKSNLDDAGAPINLHDHDAAFFALNLALLMRLDAIDYIASDRASPWVTRMSMYDLQDAPPALEDLPSHAWQPRALAWSMRQAAELAPTEMNADELAAEVSKRYWTWCDDLASEPQKATSEKAAAQKKRARELLLIQELKSKAQLYLGLTIVFGFCFLWTIFKVFSR